MRTAAAGITPGLRRLTPRSLMASRYSAYALGLEKYVRDTWCEENCPADLDLKANPIMWLGL